MANYAGRSIAFMAFCILTIGGMADTFGQNLENAPPVLLSHSKPNIPSDISIILTAGSALEIVDADQPWPPRWFSGKENKSDSTQFTYVDGRCQNGYFTFCKLVSYPRPPGGSNRLGYIRCNSLMEPIDTFNGIDLQLNYHDFRVNEKGERMVLTKLDTVLDLSSLSGNPADIAVKATVDIIEVVDANNKLVFKWNPVQRLGVNALYWPYGSLVSLSSKAGYIDWSHGNAVSWDFDGNILYSFRHIGIGKISVATGHVMWRIDRNKMPYINGNDTLAFYLQHALERVSDHAEYTTYSLYNNGDSLHPVSCALLFRVSKKDGSISHVEKKVPALAVTAMRSGNYELWPNGDYLLNYGENSNQASDRKVFLEYGNNNTVIAQYRLMELFNPYGVHRYQGSPPPRPEVELKHGKLTVKGQANQCTWYQLSGTDNTVAKQVGQGASFTPTVPGKYCVAGKYGIGYIVSRVFEVK